MLSLLLVQGRFRLPPTSPNTLPHLNISLFSKLHQSPKHEPSNEKPHPRTS